MTLLNTKKILGDIDTKGEIPENKRIFGDTIRLGWPSVLESFLLSMTGFVDTIMVSALGDNAIASVGLTTQPKFLGLCIFTALSIATSSIVARRRGENDSLSANRVLRMCVLLTLLLSGIISLAFLFGADFIVNLAGSQPETHDDAVMYLKIIMSGVIFNGLTLVINAAQRGAGNTKIAMRTNVTSNVINVIFNYLLITGNLGFPALGIKGAAIATVIGAAVGCAMSIYSVFRRGGFIDFRSTKLWIAEKKSINAMLNVGSSAFVEQLFLRIGFFLFALAVANLGTTELVAHQIGINFMSISFSVADGLAVASVALVGKSLGEGRPDMAKIYSAACQRIGFLSAIVLSFIFIVFGRPMFSLFTDSEQVLTYGNYIMIILGFVIFLQIQQVVVIGSLRGAGDARFTAMVSLVCVAILRPFLSWLFGYPLGLGLVGIWLGTATDQMIRAIVSYIRFKKGHWLNIKL